MQNPHSPDKITSVRALILDGGGHFALARRNQGGEQAGLWEFPGGKVDADETSAEAVVRESKEELGLDITLLSSFEGFERRIIPDGKHAGKPYSALGCFALTHMPSEIQPLDGVDAVGWFTVQEISQMPITSTTRNVLDRFL